MRTCKSIIAAALCFGIAGFALASLASAGALFAPTGNPTALHAADDPVRNGLRIIETRAGDAPGVQRRANEDPTVILLADWIYTGQTKPSAYK
jgi:hypothetical protein